MHSAKPPRPPGSVDLRTHSYSLGRQCGLGDPITILLDDRHLKEHTYTTYLAKRLDFVTSQCASSERHVVGVEGVGGVWDLIEAVIKPRKIRRSQDPTKRLKLGNIQGIRGHESTRMGACANGRLV